MDRSKERGAAKIWLVDQRGPVPTVLKNDKLIVMIEFSHRLQEMARISAYPGSLVVDQPSIHANHHVLHCHFGVRFCRRGKACPGAIPLPILAAERGSVKPLTLSSRFKKLLETNGGHAVTKKCLIRRS
jgi:hypothetical protein